MATSQFNSIISLFSSLSTVSTDEFKTKLYEHGILTKDYEDNNMILAYHKYETPATTDIERQSRSVVIERDTKRILSASCLVPIHNDKAQDILQSGNAEIVGINKCYEGTLISLFYYKKWYMTTRRCLDATNSLFNTETNHYEMFIDVIKQDGYETLDDFAVNLDTTKSYHFVLIHHNNKHIINYTDEFGENYKKLVLIFTRDAEQNEVEDNFKYSENVIKPIKYESLDIFSELNVNEFDEPKCEGIIIKTKTELLKLQTDAYRFYLSMGLDHNMLKGFVHLYKTDKLKEFLETNQEASVKFKKIHNPMNISETFDTVGLIDAVYKVITSELFELFKTLWSIKTGKPNETNGLYNKMTKHYKFVLYGIRGIYFSKKANQEHIRIMDVYGFIKTLSTETIINLIRDRKLLFNTSIKDKTNEALKHFITCSQLCKPFHLKLMAVFTARMFPEITNSDVLN